MGVSNMQLDPELFFFPQQSVLARVPRAHRINPSWGSLGAARVAMLASGPDSSATHIAPIY